MFWLVIVLGICQIRGKFLVRWVPSLFFFTISINVTVCALKINTAYTQDISANDLYFMLVSNYLFASVILTQCDAKIALLTQSPVWLVCAFIIKK